MQSLGRGAAHPKVNKPTPTNAQLLNIMPQPDAPCYTAADSTAPQAHSCKCTVAPNARRNTLHTPRKRMRTQSGLQDTLPEHALCMHCASGARYVSRCSRANTLLNAPPLTTTHTTHHSTPPHTCCSFRLPGMLSGVSAVLRSPSWKRPLPVSEAAATTALARRRCWTAGVGTTRAEVSRGVVAQRGLWLCSLAVAVGAPSILIEDSGCGCEAQRQGSVG